MEIKPSDEEFEESSESVDTSSLSGEYLKYDIPVIKSERSLSDFVEITKIGELEKLETYAIYGSWMGLTPVEKRNYRKRYQEALEPRSLVYMNKSSPESVPELIRLQFPPKDYDWEETDLVKTLEKMYFVYEPRYWKSFESHKFKYVGSGAPRPLFMGFIDWNLAKGEVDVEEYFQRIEYWLENMDVPSRDAIDATDIIRNLVRVRGAYIDPKTGKVMPKISLWVFFTHDQDPKRYTGGRFKALAKEKETPISPDGEGRVGIFEDPAEDRETEKVLREIEKAVEESVEESIQPWDSPEEIENKKQKVGAKRRQAVMRTFFEKSAENYVFIGRNWSKPRPNRETRIITLEGRMPIGKSRKKRDMISEKAKASLVNLNEIYKKGYLLPFLKRDVTIIASKEDLDEATEELKKFDIK